MTNEEAQKSIIHWLLASGWIAKREDIIRRVDPSLLDEPYRSIFNSHVGFFTDKRPMSMIDFNIVGQSLSEENYYMPYDLDGALKALMIHKLENMVTKELTSILSGGGQRSPTEFVSGVENMVREIYSAREGEEKTDIRSVLDEVAALEAGGGWGLSTGYSELDGFTGGLRRGAFWIIGGYANVGKTGFAIRMTDYLCTKGNSVAFYSLEMNRDVVGKKLIDYISKHRRIVAPYDVLAEYKLNIINKRRTVEQIERHIFSMEHKPDVIVIDYLHLLGVENMGRNIEEYKRITTISGALKNLAQSSGIPIVALSQVSNESAKRQSLDVMGFKGSGSLAFDCDVGIELKRDYDKESTDHVDITVLLRKNRYGEAPHKIEMIFDRKTGFIL